MARNGKRICQWATALGLCIALTLPVDASGRLYRYRNAQGHFEISNSIPTERVPLGYEILDSYSMRVVEVVEPQKTPEEVARIERETKARNACQHALDRVNRLYQSELDIESAREQALRSLQGRIENAKLNLAQLRDQKRDYETEAARLERSGQALKSALRNNIERASYQINTLEQEIDKRYKEQDDAEKSYAEDLVLFLQGTCEDEAAMKFMQARAPKHDSKSS